MIKKLRKLARKDSFWLLGVLLRMKQIMIAYYEKQFGPQVTAKFWRHAHLSWDKDQNNGPFPWNGFDKRGKGRWENDIQGFNFRCMHNVTYHFKLQSFKLQKVSVAGQQNICHVMQLSKSGEREGTILCISYVGHSEGQLTKQFSFILVLLCVILLSFQ